jgi:hypothetical protein
MPPPLELELLQARSESATTAAADANNMGLFRLICGRVASDRRGLAALVT